MPVISTNIAANSAVRYLNINSAEQTSSLSKLASGSRITQASDDAAGLAISTRISSDVTALTQAATNASHGISVLQTADGGASNITDILQRMKSLASESASGTVTDSERVYIDAEFSQLVDEVDGISTSTRYNGESLLDGTSDFSGSGVSVVVGSDASDTIQVSIGTLTAAGLGLVATADVAAVDAVPAQAAVPATDAVAATAAILTGDSADGVTLALTDDTAVFSVNGTAVTLTATSDGQTFSASDIADAINAAVTGVTASVDTDTGALVLTSDAAGDDQTVAVTSADPDVLSALGFGTTASATGTAAVAAVAAIPATEAVDAVAAVTAGDAISVATQAGATAALAAIDTATDLVSQARANIGALESRFSFRSDAISTTIENLSAANSAIMDTDVASESAKLAAAKVKTQAAVAAAAQASQMPQDLLKLMS